MRWLLIILIRIYWVVWPKAWRRKCLYRVSCSNYVYRATREGGLALGLRALQERYARCRPGYQIVASSDGTAFEALLVDGTVLRAEVANPEVLEPFAATARRREMEILATEGGQGAAVTVGGARVRQ